jgi:hypothetical protein
VAKRKNVSEAVDGFVNSVITSALVPAVIQIGVSSDFFHGTENKHKETDRPVKPLIILLCIRLLSSCQAQTSLLCSYRRKI